MIPLPSLLFTKVTMVSDSKIIVTTTDEFVAARLPDMKVPRRQQEGGAVDTVPMVTTPAAVPTVHHVSPPSHLPPVTLPAAVAALSSSVPAVLSPPSLQIHSLDAPLPPLDSAVTITDPSPPPSQIFTLDGPLPPLLGSPGPAVFTPPSPSPYAPPAPPITTMYQRNSEWHPSGYRQNVAVAAREERAEQREGWLVWFREWVDGVNERLFGWVESRGSRG